MNSYDHARFLREAVVDIDAAVVGISSARWMSVPASEATLDRATELMSYHRFDVLPVESSGGVREYFHTETWGKYSSCVRASVSHRDVISFKTSLRDLVQGFAVNPRHFYFLGDERRIVGLVSIANLNCRQVRVYLFSLLSELEIKLGNLVAGECTESELRKLTFEGEKRQKYESVQRRYDSDKAKGVEVPFIQYLYLTDMLDIIRRKRIFSLLGYESAGKCQDALGSVVSLLRNSVAHPIRSLIENPESCKMLWGQIDEIESVLFHLG